MEGHALAPIHELSPIMRPLLIYLLLLPAPGFSQTDSLVLFPEHLARTAHLLRTPFNEVRILVYGQSISMQNWWEAVRDFAQNRYPNTRLVVENRAIGGFSSERLKRMVENDVLPFYPDLVLFHVYGNEPDYEQIVRTIRSKTTAEIALQTDHVAVGQNEAWHDRHGDVWLPDLCRKYGLALIDVRRGWKEFLAKNNLQPQELLTDHVHLNDRGNALMADLVKRLFAALPTGDVPQKNVRTLRAGVDFRVKGGKLQLPLEGNRVDLVWEKPEKVARPVSVLLDGKQPSAFAESYAHTRPSLTPDGFFLRRIGQLLAFDLGPQLQAEDWSLTVLAVDSVRQQLRFGVTGSRTGPDGEGTSDTLFVSRSGRLRIPADGWFFRKNENDFRQFSWLKRGDVLRWRVFSMNRDTVVPATEPLTIVQGVPNGPHTLELTGKSLAGLKEIRVYRPPIGF